MDPKEFDPRRSAYAIPLHRAGLHARAGYEKWRGLKWPWKVLTWVLIALFAIWLVLFVTKGRFLKHPAERFMTGTLGRDVTVAGDFQFYFAPITLKVKADGLPIANPAW